MVGTSEPVAVIGVGTMGHGMASSALRAGIPTIVWDRTPEPRASSPNRGCEVAESPADAARRARDRRHDGARRRRGHRDATDEGMLAALAPGSIWVQMSTIGVAGIERVTALVEQQRPDITLVDAPVSGSKEPAEHGELTIFASGPEAVRGRSPVRRARPPDPLGRAGGHRHTREGREQHVAGIRGRSGRRFGRACLPAGSRHQDRCRRARRARWSPWQSAKLQRIDHGDFAPSSH